MDYIANNYTVDITLINTLVSQYGYDGAASILSEKVGDNLDNAYVAGALLSIHIRNTCMDQKELLTNHSSLFNKPVQQYMIKHYDRLLSVLDHSRDFGFMYRSLKTLASNYLFKVAGKPVESIQWCWMRIAVQVSIQGDDANIDEVIDNYNIFSRWEAIHATPTCVNAGFHRPQLESCFLVPVGDSMEDIQAARTLVAMGSKANGGFGLDCGRVRHSRVSNRGVTKGVPGLLKHEFNPLISYADQLGSRPGALTAFLPIWHVDITTFIRMGDRKSPETIRADNLNYSIWVQDLFHKRRIEGKTWTIFCPRETQKLWVRLNGGNPDNSHEVDVAPSLHDMWGHKFEEFYLQCEEHIDVPEDQVLDARSLWEKICIQRCQTGQPFIMNGDNVNRKSNHINQGTVTQSNLCVRGDTLILTQNGNFPIQSLVGQKVNVWNGDEWSEVVPMKTGSNQRLLTISFSNGSVLHCTYYHRFYLESPYGEMLIEAKAEDLKVGDVIIPYKLPIHGTDEYTWNEVTVIDIKDHDQHADTYCFNEPRMHRGIFNGILTGQCQEITQYTKPGELAATCDLATINLVSYVTDDNTFDWERLGIVTRQLVRNLNRVLDLTSGIIPNDGQKALDAIMADKHPNSSEYKLAEALYQHIKKDPTYTARIRNRAIGIGKMGLASALSILGLEYTSKEASLFATKVTACIYWHAVSESHNLAMKYGSYSTFEGSPMSKGILQQDMWIQESEDMDQYLQTLHPDAIANMGLSDYTKRYKFEELDPTSFGVDDTWNNLKEKVSMGMRNSLLTCQMPNVTTSAIFGVSPSVEPIYSVLYATANSTGNDTSMCDAFRVVAKREGIYDPVGMAKYLSNNHGSATGLHTSYQGEKRDKCKKVESLFKRAFDINKKKYFLMVQRMGYYVDQSQSLNWFFEFPNDKYMMQLDTMLWVNGAKNGQYYVYRKAVVDSITSNTMTSKVENVEEEAPVCRMQAGCKWCE